MLVYKIKFEGADSDNKKEGGFYMGDSLLERVMKAKKDYEVGQVIFFNNGNNS